MTIVESIESEIVVVGTGPAGLIAAAALAGYGVHVTCAGPLPNAEQLAKDTRTIALLETSVRLLERLGVWQHCADRAAPLAGIRLFDDKGGLLRAPDVHFQASELGLRNFGHNIPNSVLVAELSRHLSNNPYVELVDTPRVTKVVPQSDSVCLHLQGREIMTCRLLIGADGRNSLCRSAAGIEARTIDTNQTAIAAAFEHQHSHEGISNEFHRTCGPLTTVPLPGNRSSLVWVERPGRADQIMALGDDEFAQELQRQIKNILGCISQIGPRASFPLRIMQAEKLAANRTALLGEAAHAFPPIGAQGLNLSFRDAAMIAQCVHQAGEGGHDIGGEATLSRYCDARTTDVKSRTFAVDMLNRSLTMQLLPTDLARGLALHAIDQIPGLRRQTMRRGMEPLGPLPELMQPA